MPRDFRERGGIMPKHIGLDLGTSNLRMYMRGRGVILRAPTAVAVNRQEESVVALGKDAKSMIGRTPPQIQTFRPIRDGLIADYEVTVMMLHEYFKKTEALSFFSRPVVLVGAPCGYTEAEEMTVENSLFDAGARAVGIIKSPMAAALGAGLRVTSHRACMIADIGGGVTQVAVISSGSIVASRTVKVGGNKLDSAIIYNIRRKKGLQIGEISAEMIKVKIGAAMSGLNRGAVQVSGRNEQLKCAQTLTVSTEDVFEAINMGLEAICRAILGVLEVTPPELAGDISDYGVMLVGGGANLPGIADFISSKTGLRVTIARNPMDCECLGLGRIIENPDIFSGDVIYKNR